MLVVLGFVPLSSICLRNQVVFSFLDLCLYSYTGAHWHVIYPLLSIYHISVSCLLCINIYKLELIHYVYFTSSLFPISKYILNKGTYSFKWTLDIYWQIRLWKQMFWKVSQHTSRSLFSVLHSSPPHLTPQYFRLSHPPADWLIPHLDLLHSEKHWSDLPWVI